MHYSVVVILSFIIMSHAFYVGRTNSHVKYLAHAHSVCTRLSYLPPHLLEPAYEASLHEDQLITGNW